MSEDDSDAILTAYRTGLDPDGDGGVHVRLVPFDEIKANDFDLNIGRYVASPAEEAVDLATAFAAYQDARAGSHGGRAAHVLRLDAAGIERPRGQRWLSGRGYGLVTWRGRFEMP